MSQPSTPPCPPTPSLPPPTPSSSSKRVVIVPEPSKFNGATKDFDAWIMSLKIYFAIHAEKFVNNKKHCLAVLSHMEGGTTGPWVNPFSPQSTTLNPNKPQSTPFSLDRQTNMGITFGGHGKAMDIDMACQENCCFNCGKVGHFSHDCHDPPKAKFNAQALALDLTDDKKKELLEQILPKEENTDQIFETVNI
jgi:hypothetical protein